MPLQQKKKKRTAGAAAPAAAEEVDFRASNDDAWYGARLRVEPGGWGGAPEHYLRVMYSDFPEAWDERFRAGAFADEAALEGFSRRFRRPCLQLQDRDCRGVVEGMTVCASYAFGDSDVRFYDAVVEEVSWQVCSSEHEIIEGEESCTCTFLLLWQHGPNAGRKTTTGIEHICLQQRVAQIHPALALFLELSRENIKSTRQSNVSARCSKTSHATVKNEPNGSGSKLPETRSSQQLGDKKEIFTGRRCTLREGLGQDTDLGGNFNKSVHPNIYFYFIMVENLEKDLSPQTIVDFIYQQTSILSQAHISPSLISEPYTRGTIFLDTKEKADRLSSFIQNREQIIMSSRGRPWVIAERKLRYGSAGPLFKSEKQISNKVEVICEIKVVRAGSKEYAKAKKLQELFTEFRDHLDGLHKRLALEEMKLLQMFYAT